MWAMMSMLQMLSYATLLKLHFPPNLLIFFDCLESVHNFNKAMPNLFGLTLKLSELDLNPFNAQYEDRGFYNRNLLLLCGPDLMTLSGFLLLIAVLVPLSQSCSYSISEPADSSKKSRKASAIVPCIEPSCNPTCVCV
jgi:hypothetical protein